MFDAFYSVSAKAGVFVRQILGSCRRRVEGLFFLVLFPALAVGLVCAIVRRVGRRGTPVGLKREVAVTLRRWGQFLGDGLKILRNEWWVEFSLDSSFHLWRYVLLFEVFELLNLAEGPRVDDEGRMPSSVLSVKLVHFGDVLHMVPMLRGLRASLPAVRSDLLVGPWCKELGEKIPYINKTTLYAPRLDWFCRGDRRHQLGWFGEFALLRQLRRQTYDVVILTSTLSYVELLLVHAVRPRRWVGASTSLDIYFPYSTSKMVQYDSREYEATREARLLTLLGLPPVDDALEYWVSESDIQFRDRLFAERAVGVGESVVVLAPGAGWPGKIWPCERFAEVAEWMVKERQVRIIVVGSANEKALAACIERRVPETINIVGQTSWGQLAGVLQRARLWIGNDSGSMHLAAALGVPTVALFGPTVVSKWAPRGKRHIVLQHEYSCPDCIPWHPSAKCRHDNACMVQIGVEEVKAAVARQLNDALATNRR